MLTDPHSARASRVTQAMLQVSELVPNERLRYTDKFDDPNLPGEIEVTVTLEPASVGTELTPRSEIYVYDLAVAASYRRQGIATALIAKLASLNQWRLPWESQRESMRL